VVSSKTELIVDFSELRRVSIPCTKCATRVVLDLVDEEAGIPEECPSCGKEYGDSFRTALHTLRQVYRKLSAQGERQIQICVQKPE